MALPLSVSFSRLESICTVVRDINFPFFVNIQYGIRLTTLREPPIHLPMDVNPSPVFSLWEIWSYKPKYIFPDIYSVSPVTYCSGSVSDSHIPSNRFFCNILYARYLRINGTTSNQISSCVVLLSVYFAYSIPIFHRSMISSGNNDE